MRQNHERIITIYQHIQDAGEQGITFTEFGIGAGESKNLGALLASMESYNIRIAEDDSNRLYAPAVFEEPEIAFNRDYDYYCNRLSGRG